MKIALLSVFAIVAASVQGDHLPGDHNQMVINSRSLLEQLGMDHASKVPTKPCDDDNGGDDSNDDNGGDDSNDDNGWDDWNDDSGQDDWDDDNGGDDWNDFDNLPSNKPDDSGNDADRGGRNSTPVPPDNDCNKQNDRSQRRSKQPLTPVPTNSSIDKRSKRPATPVPSTPTPSNSSGDGSKGQGSGWEAQMLQAVNAERSKQGLKALCINHKLTKAAAEHAADMAAKKYFDHNSQDGRSPFDRIKAAGFKDGTEAENIAQGQKDVADVMKSWMNSAGHRANILGKNYAMVGFGMTSNYWVQDFGGSQGEQCG